MSHRGGQCVNYGGYAAGVLVAVSIHSSYLWHSCSAKLSVVYLSFICRLVINVLCNSRQQPGVSEEIHGKEAEEESIVGRHGRSPAAQTRLKTLS